MLFAAKAINGGYSAAYCAEAKVYHSHDHSLSELFKRNFRQGYEIERHWEQLGDISLESEGLKMVSIVGKELLSHGHALSFLMFGVECGARLLGNRMGRRKARKSASKTEEP